MKRNVFLRLIAAVTAAVLLLSCSGSALASFDDFSDIEGHWAKETMRLAYNNGLIEGYNDKLSPDGPMTGAQMITIICRALDATREADISSLDLPKGAWYADAAAKAVYLGIISEYWGDLEAPVRRSDAFDMILKSFQLESAYIDTGFINNYSDTFTYPSEVRKILADAIQAGLVEGYQGALNAYRLITRAEFMTVLMRAVSNFAQASDITAEPASRSILYGDAEFSGINFDENTLFACDAENIKLSGIYAKNLIISSNELDDLGIIDGSSIDRLVLANREGDIELLPQSSVIGTLVVGTGAGSVIAGQGVGAVEITGSGRVITITQSMGNIDISGDNNTVFIEEGVKITQIRVSGDGNELIIHGSSDRLILLGENTVFAGSGTVERAMIYCTGFDFENPGITINNAQDLFDPGIADMNFSLKAPDSLPVEETLVVTAELYKEADIACEGRWYVDGKEAERVFIKAGDKSFQITRNYNYWKDMPKETEISFTIRYITASDWVQLIGASKRITIENYSDEYYRQRDAERVLSLVSSAYRGNYTLQYALDNDYRDFEKEIWVNAKGYSSDTQYLIWVNLAYQRVNIFEGSLWNWKLVRSGIVGTGAPGTGTPVGVWKTTYKQEYGWTTGTYTVRPVVRFKGGGYAFHSRLYRPGTWTLSDASIGFPVSHGCIRMYQEDIQWLYDYVPDGTTVVVY